MQYDDNDNDNDNDEDVFFFSGDGVVDKSVSNEEYCSKRGLVKY